MEQQLTTPTYLIYTDSLSSGEASLWVEMGSVAAVPTAGQRITVDGIAYVAVEVLWDVYSKSKNYGTDRSQCATVLLRREGL